MFKIFWVLWWYILWFVACSFFGLITLISYLISLWENLVAKQSNPNSISQFRKTQSIRMSLNHLFSKPKIGKKRKEKGNSYCIIVWSSSQGMISDLSEK